MANAKPKAKEKAAPKEKSKKKSTESEESQETTARPSRRGSGRDLIIVESPTKAKTIRKYLDGDYEVLATVGHIKDLPKSKLGVDVENDFEPSYESLPGKKKVLDDIVDAAGRAQNVYLAPDPDREGEAIAFHVAEMLGGKGKRAKAESTTQVRRVLFHEITKRAILEALKKPMDINVHLFEAHKARRVLDRLVGYKISPVLWDKVRRGLSAGRVQSVAVRMICEREREIRAFVPVEYWNLAALLAKKTGEEFESKLFRIGDAKAELSNEADTKALLERVRDAEFKITKIERKERRDNPLPPFITSKLQQEAANKFGFTTKKTMTLSQQLYEGIELGDAGTTGLITYMRTDSVRLSDDSIQDARSFIERQYGKQHMPEAPIKYKTRKDAQDAHEAIRPTSTEFPPDRVKQFLDRDQFRLYELIWNRFIACQMNSAILDRTSVDISAADCIFRATGSIVKYPGYLQVYEEEDEATKADHESKTLPDLAEGEVLTLRELKPTQHFTQPPPRYTESSLVKALEENGIGRPSTYASIMSTIVGKDYVRKDAGKFFPTDLGMLVTDLLVESFPDILNVEFTARMEEQLDGVEEGSNDWIELLRDFYKRFKADLEKAKGEMRNMKAQEIPTDILCEKCQQPMVIKWGKNGEFLACSKYPECRSTKEFVRDEKGNVQIREEEDAGQDCDKCGKPMKVKRGRFGTFLACSGYPDCKNTKAIPTGVVCPEPNCGGDIVVRTSRRGKVFYSCSRYPNCKYALWDKPIAERCPNCDAPFLVEKYSKKTGPMVKCLKGDYERSNEG